MRIALDTNVLLHLVNEAAREHQNAVSAIGTLNHLHFEICTMPQNLVEFLGVATRPVSNGGLGMTTLRAAECIHAFESVYRVPPEDARVFSTWKKLVVAHRVLGKQVHDTRLAAALHVHDVPNLLTSDAGGFGRFGFLTVLTPMQIRAGALP